MQSNASSALHLDSSCNHFQVKYQEFPTTIRVLHRLEEQYSPFSGKNRLFGKATANKQLHRQLLTIFCTVCVIWITMSQGGSGISRSINVRVGWLAWSKSIFSEGTAKFTCTTQQKFRESTVRDAFPPGEPSPFEKFLCYCFLLDSTPTGRKLDSIFDEENALLQVTTIFGSDCAIVAFPHQQPALPVLADCSLRTLSEFQRKQRSLNQFMQTGGAESCGVFLLLHEQQWVKSKHLRYSRVKNRL